MFAVNGGEAPQWVIPQLYEVADTRDLPLAAQGESTALRYRMRARHQLKEPDSPVDRASDKEIVALLRACLSARDRLIVLLLSRAGLRRGEAAGLRRSDLHLLPDNRVLGCDIEGAHLHVIRRENINGAWAKSRHVRAVPLDFLVVQAVDQYQLERIECPAARDSDFLLVNLFRATGGQPGDAGGNRRAVQGTVSAGGPGQGGDPAPVPARVRQQPRGCRSAGGPDPGASRDMQARRRRRSTFTRAHLGCGPRWSGCRCPARRPGRASGDGTTRGGRRSRRP